MHLSTAARIIARVARAIASLYNEYIKIPITNEEIVMKQLNFFHIARFPRVIGAIDCTYIRIQSPGREDAEVFRNRKGYFSINVQVVADADLRLMNVVARRPGSSHDSTIFNDSRLKQQLDHKFYILM